MPITVKSYFKAKEFCLNIVKNFPQNLNLITAVIDDDKEVALSLKYILNSLGQHHVTVFNSAEEFLSFENIAQFNLIYTDLIMPGVDGFGLIERLKNKGLETPIVVVSAFSAVENTVRAIKLGAFDFVLKPFDVDIIANSIFKLLKNQEINKKLQGLAYNNDNIETDPFLSKIIGHSTSTKKLIEMIQMVRDIDAPVLIEGETGTSKELIAQAIHADKGAFVPVNVSAVNNELIESELFGHLRGSFTGAITNRIGLFEQANGGTLFFDEINSMSAQMQAKVLRSLQERKVRPVGASQEKEIDFRLISATNTSLYNSISSGLFRLDLFHRLNVIHLKIDPLRERIEDISSLAHSFLEKFCNKHHCELLTFSDTALNGLERYSWPGNVRELENVIERLVIFSDKNAVITDFDLSKVLGQDTQGFEQSGEQFKAPLDLTLKDLEHQYAMSVLAAKSGNKSEAAKSLNIDFKTLTKKINV